MGLDQYYEKVDSDENNAEGLMTGEKSSRVMRAPPPTGSTERSALTTLALGAVLVTIFLAAVAIVSSAVVSYRLPAATEAALRQQGSGSSATTSAVVPVKSNGVHSETGTGFEGMDGADSDSMGGSSSPASSGPVVIGNDTMAFDLGHHQNMRSCGGTPDEARAAGCVFDVMMQLWTPPECMDSPLSERFLANGNWTWYADSAAQTVYSDEEIRKGNHDVVYVAQSYHRHHCIFAWERLVRAMRNQAPLIEELISYDHVMHCRHKTLTLPSEGAESVRGVVAPTGYTRCASYDVWIKSLPFNKMSSTD